MTSGDVLLHDTKDSYVRSDAQLVAALRVEALVIVSTKDAVLVVKKSRVEDVKIIARRFELEAKTEWEIHREVYPRQGKHDFVDGGEGYQVKRITVNPGKKLSVLKHHYRAEHWVVVAGTARVTNGEETFLLQENESTYISIGVIHALENPGKIPLEIIEIQPGSYLGEDDIVRLEDHYGRDQCRDHITQWKVNGKKLSGNITPDW